MKTNLFKLSMFAAALMSTNSMADTYVDGYFKADGTYVMPYVRSDSNSTNLDNYSTQGNSNPYTGSEGTRARDYSPEAYNYGSGRTIQTGPRGG